MFIDKRYKLHEIASSKNLHISMQCVNIDTERHQAIATNNRAVAIVPAVIDEGDKGGLIPADAMKKAGDPMADVELGDQISVTKHGAKTVFSRPDSSLRIPPWKLAFRNMFSKFCKPVTLTLDAELLAKLQAAICSPLVTLVFDPTTTGAVLVKGERGAYGAIMRIPKPK